MGSADNEKPTLVAPKILGTRELMFPESMHGRGIVIVGGGKFLPSGYLAIKQIRSTGCALPIEFWHLGPAELPAKLIPAFAALGTKTVDAFKVRDQRPMKNLGGWECKPYAMAYSGFEEILFIDADNLILIDPTFLFDHPAYTKNTAMFWPDFPPQEDSYWRIKPRAFELLGLPEQSGLEIESGQMVIHKRKAWNAMTATVSMNDESDFFYQHCSYGDKDTYTLSWLLTGTPYFRVEKIPTIVTEMVRTHYTPEGSPLFEHGRKWVLPVEANRVVGPSVHDQRCFGWLTEFTSLLYG